MVVKWQEHLIEISNHKEEKLINLYEYNQRGRIGSPLIISGHDVTVDCDTFFDKSGVQAKGHFQGNVYNIGEPFFLTVDFLADLKTKTVMFRHYMTPEESEADNE